MLFFVILGRRWVSSFPEDYKLACLGALMMLVMLPVVSFSTVIGDRFGYYLIPIQTMIFARFPFLNLGRSSNAKAAMPYLGLLLVFTVWASFSSLFQQCYLPYNSWLFGFPEGLPFRF